MKPYQCIGWALINTSAISAITTRVNHGMRPSSSAASSLPAINFYELPGTRQNGIVSTTFSINCRATTADIAMNLAEKVIDLFHGSSGTGTYGDFGTAGNPFSVARASLKIQSGLIPEPDNNCYNAPVDVLIVYTCGAVT